MDLRDLPQPRTKELKVNVYESYDSGVKIAGEDYPPMLFDVFFSIKKETNNLAFQNQAQIAKFVLNNEDCIKKDGTTGIFFLLIQGENTHWEHFFLVCVRWHNSGLKFNMNQFTTMRHIRFPLGLNFLIVTPNDHALV